MILPIVLLPQLRMSSNTPAKLRGLHLDALPITNTVSRDPEMVDLTMSPMNPTRRLLLREGLFSCILSIFP
jgi:hypothetical protein